MTTLPKGWSEVALGEVAVVDRSTVTAAEITSGTLYVGLEDIEAGGAVVRAHPVEPGELGSNKFRFDPSHILYGKLRPYLAKIASAPVEGICSTDILPIRPTKVDQRYLLHFLRQPAMVDHATARSSGANLPRLAPKDLERFSIPLPPLDEQRRIAAILDKADELRAKRRAALNQLDSLTQSIFLDMFGDPVANRHHWISQHLGDLVREGDRINYGVVQPGSDDAEGVPIVRVGDLLGGMVRMDSLKRISAAVESKYSRSRLQGDELLVSCVGSIGTVAFASPDVAGFNIARAVARVPLTHRVNRLYAGHYLRSARAQRYFADQVRTVTQPTLNIKQIKECPVLLPPLELQAVFAARAERVAAAARQGHSAAKTLGILSASLQTQAFRGEL